MQITLRLYVDNSLTSQQMVGDLRTAISEDEGITITTAAGKYFVELDSMEVR